MWSTVFQPHVSCVDSGEPLRVNFSLQFDTLEGLDLDRIQGLVITLITEHAIRHTVQDLMVLQVPRTGRGRGGGGGRGEEGVLRRGKASYVGGWSKTVTERGHLRCCRRPHGVAGTTHAGRGGMEGGGG